MKKGSPAVGIVIGAIFVVMLLFFAYTIYCVIYKASRGSDFAYLGDYTTFINVEDNLSPDYSRNDLIIARKETYYSTSEVVIYRYNSSYRLGRVVMTSTSKYYVGDSMNAKGDELSEITYPGIVGAAHKNLKGLGGIFKIMSSVGVMVIVAIMFFAYMMFAKEK